MGHLLESALNKVVHKDFEGSNRLGVQRGPRVHLLDLPIPQVQYHGRHRDVLLFGLQLPDNGPNSEALPQRLPRVEGLEVEQEALRGEDLVDDRDALRPPHEVGRHPAAAPVDDRLYRQLFSRISDKDVAGVEIFVLKIGE